MNSSQVNATIRAYRTNVSFNVEFKFPDSLLNLDKKIARKLPGTMRRIAMEAKSFWKAEAGRKLKSSRLEYQKGLDFKVEDETTFTLSLTGFLPVAIELGNPGFDMKPGLLAGRRYRVIPLNPKRFINMTRPKDFAVVSINSKPDSWQHPGWKGRNLISSVISESVNNIIPKHIKKMLEEP